MYGAAHQFSAILEKVAEAGLVRFTGEPIPTSEELTYAFRTEPARFVHQLNLLIHTTAHAIDARPGMKLVKAGAEEKPAEPVPVRIIEMPIRRTKTTIDRDANGEISSSLQIESDA
jgi:hypothetical protein